MQSGFSKSPRRGVRGAVRRRCCSGTIAATCRTGARRNDSFMFLSPAGGRGEERGSHELPEPPHPTSPPSGGEEEDAAMTKLEGVSYEPQAGGRPGHLVVLLHGYGADGNDLIGLAPVLAPLMPDVVFHAPNAPYPCEGNPFGYQWFGISRLDPKIAADGVRSAA